MLADEIRNKKNMPILEAIAYGMRLFKDNFIQLMFIVFIIYFPLSLLSGYISLVIAQIEAGIDLNSMISNAESLLLFVQSDTYRSFAVYNMLNTVIDMFLAPFGAMAVISIINDACEGEAADYKKALLLSFSRGPRFILLRIASIAVCALFYLLFIIPGVIVSVCWCFYLEALVIDDQKCIKALSFSREIVSGRWFKTLFFTIVCWAMNYGLSYIVSLFFMWGSNSYVAEVFFKVIIAALNMIFIAAETVIYINFKANPAEKSRKIKKSADVDNH